MRRLTTILPEDVYLELRTRALREGVSTAALLERLLRRALGLPQQSQEGGEKE